MKDIQFVDAKQRKLVRMKSVSWNWKLWFNRNGILLNWNTRHMKRLLPEYYNTKLSRTVYLNFSFIENAAIFRPENGYIMFI
jgi:hypothetical protein